LQVLWSFAATEIPEDKEFVLVSPTRGLKLNFDDKKALRKLALPILFLHCSSGNKYAHKRCVLFLYHLKTWYLTMWHVFNAMENSKLCHGLENMWYSSFFTNGEIIFF
jgi:hypothetical protein